MAAEDNNMKTSLNREDFSKNRAEETNINLPEILSALRKRWWLILICVVVFGAVLGVYCQFFVSSAYQAEASLYITVGNNESSEVSFSNLQSSSALTKDYENIIKNRYVLMQVIDNLGLKVNYDELYDMITVINPEETHIIQINVVCEIPEDAITIANEVMKVSSDEIYKIIGGSEPAVVSEAMYAENVKPSTLKFAIVGILAGLVLSCGWISIRVIADNTIKTEDDVTNALELPVLATVPKNSNKKSSLHYGYGYGYGKQKNAGGARG